MSVYPVRFLVSPHQVAYTIDPFVCVGWAYVQWSRNCVQLSMNMSGFQYAANEYDMLRI